MNYKFKKKEAVSYRLQCQKVEFDRPGERSPE